MGNYYVAEMKDINISSFNFPGFIQYDFFYVDKTEYVWKLVRRGAGAYFLSRPRRFGKSLLLSTLKALFQGKRELFRGLAIDKMDYDWKEYPVIHLDFGTCVAENKEEMAAYLLHELDRTARDYGIPSREGDYVMQFENLIWDLSKLYPTGKVVILVDEYDKPILSNITNEKVSEILRVLKGFYGVIKKCDAQIRFAFITGVSKFTRVSLFSDLNNLKDLTLNPDYAGMLGFTEEEIRKHYADEIPNAAKKNGCSEEELMQRLLKWYDGYRFSEAETHVCNPVSLNMFFDNHYKFSNYWDETGTPRFLLELARDRYYDYEEELGKFHYENIFSAYDFDHLDITGLLWQTGYLTIKEVTTAPRGEDRYLLDFPDFEVADSFNLRILEYYAKLGKGNGGPLLDDMQNAICEGNLEGFMKLFQSVLAGIKYEMHLPYEKYYQTIFFVVFRLLGLCIEAESHTNEGSIDAYIRTARKIYIFEFKVNKDTETAIGQILDRRYYEKFCNEGLPIVLVGANFDSSKGRIDSWGETTA